MKYVIKADGSKEPFDIEKFKRSLKKSGATEKIIEKLAKDIRKQPELKTTQQIYYYALEKLKKEHRPVAARYNLKKALSNLGPTGFPLEEFIGQLFSYQGYKTRVGVFVTGFCVEHEVDVVAEKGEKCAMVEVKFHAQQGTKLDVKVTLYVNARFQDIKKEYETDPQNNIEFDEAWLATNTKFTTEAIRYATCVNLKLLGWSYPAKENIAQLIDDLGLHPITCLTSLNKKQITELIKKGFVLCKDVSKHVKHLKELGLSEAKIKQVQEEAEGVCTL